MAASETELNAWRASAELHQRFLTGLILRAIAFKGEVLATELNFRTFRAQHLEKFLAGYKSLGLDKLPPAIACAQYIYLANHVGGVKCEFVAESDRKAWVRYLPPRWIWDGAAICAVPNEVSIAFMRGFHSQVGVSLGNPNLGFVCTAITTRADPCLEGYFIEEDRPLAETERLRFRYDEEGPDADPSKFPRVDWTEERMVKAKRNYAVQYIRSILPAAVSLLGEEAARKLGWETGRLIGMQCYDTTAAFIGTTSNDAESFARYLAALLDAGGDAAKAGGAAVSTRTWRMMAGKEGVAPACFDAWNALFEGALAVHNRRLRLDVTSRMDTGADHWGWQIV
tara:strand:+ start:1354 stop:2373 length:1020 start_codon:yes stop_codon:yes gene_type:complete